MGQAEIQIGGLHVGLAHGDEAGIRGAHRGELARQPAAAVGEIERVDVDLEQAPAVRADVDVAVQHGARRETAADERQVGERRGVGFGGEVVEHGVARPAQLPLEAEPRARESHAPQVGFEGIAGDTDAALQLGDAQRRIAGGDRERADVRLDALLAWGREPQCGDPRRQMLEAPDPPPPVGPGVFDLVEGVVRAGTILQPQHHRAVLDAEVAEHHEGRRPSRRRPAEPQQLFQVQPAVLVLYEVDVGVVERHAAQHDAAGHEVERVVVHLGVRQPGDERRVRVVDRHVTERDAGEQRAAHVADFDAPRDDAVERRARCRGEQCPSRVGPHQRREPAERAGDEPHQRPEHSAQPAADHQNACPTANWKTIRFQNDPGRGTLYDGRICVRVVPLLYSSGPGSSA